MKAFIFAISLILCHENIAQARSQNLTDTSTIESIGIAGDEFTVPESETLKDSNFGTQRRSGYGFAWCRAWVTCKNGRTIGCEANSRTYTNCIAKKSRYVSCEADYSAAFEDRCN